MIHDDRHYTMDNTLAELFRRAFRLMARVYHRRDHAHHAQHHILYLIMERGPMPQGELLEILDVRSASLSEVLGKLERQGMIVRERNEKDKRSFVVSATPLARTLAAGRGGGIKADGLFACLDDEERLQLGNILEKIITSLKADPLSVGPGNGRQKQCRGRGKGGGRGNGIGRHGGRGGTRNDDVQTLSRTFAIKLFTDADKMVILL
eukprot:TRINITY_DN66346_c0_g1_i1.p3 TRINITY_DN66346_c0_g1~~TRINITY_DN66346_c0_g1_i1.p3  ORF type:complete len:207 (-),score=38.97 TRINITY_DN66346_c0_g1_i1:312-932(-)